MARTPFACAYDDAAGTITVSGDLDEAGALELQRRLASLLTGHSRDLVMDLRSVGALPGLAVGVIAAARADMRAHFHRLDLVAEQSSPAARVLLRSGMVPLSPLSMV